MPQYSRELLLGATAEGPVQFLKPAILEDLWKAFGQDRKSLVQVTWEQQRLHESRRWSAVDMIDSIALSQISEMDMMCIWNAGRAELTTKPGADRLARLADQECRLWIEKNDTVSSVLQACGTWSRYWNEEEAFHETSLNQLSLRLGLERISDATFIEYRKIFPNDDMLRTLVLLTISEITAAVNYGLAAKLAKEPGLKALFRQIAADEMQHMNYFVSFAKALVDSGEYHPKNAFAVAHFFLRDNGDLYGSRREKLEHRNSHVNWWDTLESKYNLDLPDVIEKQRAQICANLARITGIAVNSPAEVEEKWMELVGC
jgi:hypothetical protein